MFFQIEDLYINPLACYYVMIIGIRPKTHRVSVKTLA